MSKFEIDLDQVAFDQHGQQIGVEVPEGLLDCIAGADGNGECGRGCGGANNGHCGNNCGKVKSLPPPRGA